MRLCAPTGKAARRLAETTGAQATTIHRLLEYSPDEGFVRGPDDPIPGTDLLIVDEASMLSVRLAEALFGAVGRARTSCSSAMSTSSRPSARAASSTISSSPARVPVVRLTEIFRQAARSLIVRAAHAVNDGKPPPTKAGAEDAARLLLHRARGRARLRRTGDLAGVGAPARSLRPRRRAPRCSCRADAPRPGRHRRAQRRAARTPERRWRRDPRHGAARAATGSSRPRTTTSASS